MEKEDITAAQPAKSDVANFASAIFNKIAEVTSNEKSSAATTEDESSSSAQKEKSKEDILKELHADEDDSSGSEESPDFIPAVAD